MLDAALRRALFLLEPEASHHAALRLLAAATSVPGGEAALRSLYAPAPQPPVELCGLRFANRVGLAAGYDKNAVAWRGLAALGFGHVELGTVTPRPQAGNPTPRVFRLADQRCLINRLGFPSEGAAAMAARLRGARGQGVVIGVNLGKNKETPNEQAASDYVTLVEQLAPLADYLTVNVSSPNTPGLRALQTGPALRALLSEVRAARDAVAAGLGRLVPVWVKLSPDLDDHDLDDALQALLDVGMDGVIVANTTLSREGVVGPLAAEAGGLSGALLTARAGALVGRVRARVGDGLPLVSVGGIMGPDDAKARLDAGADLVQLYTGLVFGGPGLVRSVVQALA
jgi:dihydroorotate dehydrogenase